MPTKKGFCIAANYFEVVQVTIITITAATEVTLL